MDKEATRCRTCGKPVKGRQKYCSNACRQKAYRERKKRDRVTAMP